MPHLVKKGFLTTCLTTDSFGTHGNSGVKRCEEYAETSRNHRKWPETYRKNLVQPFGSKMPGVRVSPLGPNNDNPNYIIQVGNVFGFIISIENIL